MIDEEHLGRWVGAMSPIDVTIEGRVRHVKLSFPDIRKFYNMIIN